MRNSSSDSRPVSEINLESQIHDDLEPHLINVVTLPIFYSQETICDNDSEATVEEKEKWDEKVEKRTSSLVEVKSLTEDEQEILLRDSKLLKGRKLWISFIAFLLAAFVASIDATILAPAVPVIVSDFGALDKVAWVAAAYGLGQAPVLLLAGQVLQVFEPKFLFQISVLVFELGSIISAAAHSMDVMIVGRGVTGAGAGLIIVASLSILADITTLRQRPLLLGLLGAVGAVSSLVGPVLGGFLTDQATWRWCFIINVPIGLITVVAAQYSLKPMPPPALKSAVVMAVRAKIDRLSRGYWKPAISSVGFRLAILDWMGGFFVTISVTSFLLALSWGGTTYSWDSGEVISTFILSIVFGALFLYNEENWATTGAVMPLRLWKNPTQIGANLVTFCSGFNLLVVAYYLPIFFQAVLGQTAIQSGLSLLPLLLATLASSSISGILISYFGYYTYLFVFGPIPMAFIGGLLYTWSASTSWSIIIGYQVIFGFGLGTVLQTTTVAVQATVKLADIPQATALLTFCHLMGGTVGVSISAAIFRPLLDTNIKKFAPLAPFALVESSITAITLLPSGVRESVISAYAEALNGCFLILVPISVIALFSAFLIKNINIKTC